MKYRNTRTQAVIETACEVRGGDWEKVEEQPKEATKTAPKKSSRKRVVNKHG